MSGFMKSFVINKFWEPGFLRCFVEWIEASVYAHEFRVWIHRKTSWVQRQRKVPTWEREASHRMSLGAQGMSLKVLPSLEATESPLGKRQLSEVLGLRARQQSSEALCVEATPIEIGDGLDSLKLLPRWRRWKVLKIRGPDRKSSALESWRQVIGSPWMLQRQYRRKTKGERWCGSIGSPSQRLKASESPVRTVVAG